MTDPDTAKRVLDICDGAVPLSGEARERYLVKACGGNSGLREQVDELLQAIEDSGTFLQMEDSASKPED